MKKLNEFLLNNSDKKQPLVIVCPGGAYTHHSPREAEPVAKKFNSFGFHSVVLRYAIYPRVFPDGLIDLFKTIWHYRKNAEKLGIDKIIVCGFSAGGHLCASSGVFWNQREYSEKLKCKPEDIRPDALCLCYPVINASKYANRLSFINLTGSEKEGQSEDNYTPSLYSHLSVEKFVTSDCPPAFLWHTLEDTYVPPENSILFAKALKKHKIPCEVHLYSKGQHGISLATEETSRENHIDVIPECQTWPDLLKNFIETIFY
jgi:acetyl esterase/lipase